MDKSTKDSYNMEIEENKSMKVEENKSMEDKSLNILQELKGEELIEYGNMG